MTLILFLGIFSSLVPLFIILAVVAAVITGKKETEIAIPANQTNKVVNVTLTGGIIGMFISSPRNDLNARIRVENANGWKVVQVIPADSGNVFLAVFRLILLVFTLFLYTTSNGYYVIMERTQIDKQIIKDTQVVKDLKCSKCGKEFSSDLKGTFCEECGNKL